MPDTAYEIPITAAQPSQLYIDADRLTRVVSWFDFEAPNYDPIPVVSSDHFSAISVDRPVLTDGHTRAFVALLAGHDTLVVVEDSDWETMDQQTYDACVSWCIEAGITDIGELIGRVVDRETFLEQWVDRCETYGADH